MPIPSEFQGQWIGDLNGTLMGRLYAEFSEDGERVLLQLYANIDGRSLSLRGHLFEREGNTVCSLLLDGNVAVEAVPPDPNQNNVVQRVQAAPAERRRQAFAELVFEDYSDARLAGRWFTLDGNRGVIRLVVANTSRIEPRSEDEQNVLQVVSRREDIPKLRLSRADLLDFVTTMKRSLPTPNDVAVAIEIDGNEVVQFAPVFFSRNDLPNELESLRLTLNDQADGKPRSIQLNFSNLESHLLVSATDEVWVTGVWQNLRQSIERRSSVFSWWFQKHGLNLNGFLFLVAIAFLPDLPTIPRIVFLSVVVISVFSFKYFHSLVDRVRVQPRADTPPASKVGAGEVVTAAAGGVLTILIVGLFNFLSGGGLVEISSWLSRLLATQ